MKKLHLKKITLSGMFLALALVLPFLTGQIPEIGNLLLPMHIPVLLCGLICGWQYGGIVGFLAPLLRNAFFGMPPMPKAVSMAFELMTYGLVVGLIYLLFRNRKNPENNVLPLYVSMLTAMLAGRVVWGIAQVVVFGLNGKTFTWTLFIGGAFLEAIPGIILQLVLIPAIMLILQRMRLIPLTGNR